MSVAALKREIHRKLLRRLALAASLIAVVFALVAWVAGNDRVATNAAEIARVQLDHFNARILPLVDTDPIDSSGIQAAIDAFAGRSPATDVTPRDGRFVAVRVYDLDGRELARLSDADYADIGAVNAALDSSVKRVPEPGATNVVQVTLDGRPYVGVGVPLVNGAGRTVVLVEAAFAISDEALARLRANSRQAIVYVVLIVLLTAGILYPLIRGLLDRLTGATSDLLDANLETLQVLGGAIAKRDSDTDAHNFRVTVYAVHLAREAGMDGEAITRLIKGSLLHDVGKLGIRDNVLLKPGKLDVEEFAVMKTHVEHGLDIISRADWLADAADVVGGHHEKFDGSGYPAGLKGEAIPTNARVFAVVDVFDALTSRRPYKEPFSFDKTMAILDEGAGSHFDPALLDLFRNIARGLYDTYANDDGEKSRLDLEDLVHRYFSGMESLGVSPSGSR